MLFVIFYWILIDDFEEKDSYVFFFFFCSEKLGYLGIDCFIIKW